MSPNALRRLLLALQFLTRIPVTGRLAGWVGYSPQLLRESAPYFPLVGALVGVLAAAAMGALWWLLPAVPAAAWVAAVVALACGLLLTGAFHEDGLADTFDGLGGSPECERALEIMKDSRIGSYGALALGVALLAQCALLATLLQTDVALALVALVWAHTVSRCAPLWMLHRQRHVGDLAGAKSKPLADGLTGRGLLGALALAALLVAPGLWWVSGADLLAGLLGALLGAAWMGRWLLRRLGGYTGDGLGAMQQAATLGLLLGVALQWPGAAG